MDKCRTARNPRPQRCLLALRRTGDHCLPTQTDERRKMPGVVISVVTLLGTVVFMGAFMATYQALGVGVPYVGLFFLLYWAAMLHQDPAQYLPTVLGGLVGIGLAWLLMALPPLYGQAGFYGSYAALGLVLFCYIRGQALYFVNNGTMLFVLLAVIPELNVIFH